MIKKIVLHGGGDEDDLEDEKREFKVTGERSEGNYDVVCDTCENEHAEMQIGDGTAKLYCQECGKLEFIGI